MATLHSRIQAVRRDVGNLLFHFTRARDVEIDGRRVVRSAAQNLYEIMRTGKLLGSSGYIRGGYDCVCFSEAPISEAVSLFKLSAIAADGEERPRYEPYGVAVTKEWLFEKGGRPVIYQPGDEYDHLPEVLRYRHVRYEPSAGIDHTWEREWRIQASELSLDPESTLIIVPKSSDAFDLMYDYSNWEADFDRDGTPMHAYPIPEWMAVSLDFFGLDEQLR